jgi:hypothetical protein
MMLRRDSEALAATVEIHSTDTKPWIYMWHVDRRIKVQYFEEDLMHCRPIKVLLPVNWFLSLPFTASA